MAGDFTTEPLGNVASVQGGFAFKSSDFTNSGIPVLKIKNIRLRDVDASDAECVTEEVAQVSRRFFCKHGDVLISMTGSGPQAPNSIVGRTARYTGPSDHFLINQRVGKFVVKEPTKLDSHYLFYFLTQQHIQWSLVSVATGSANQANISNAQIEKLQIPLPVLREQQAIAYILGALDNKIELNRRRSRTLEEMARAIFQSWFVDFDPVRANAEGRKPSGLKKEIAALFPNSFEESKIGPIPVGWRMRTVGDNFRVTMGQSPPGETYNEFGEGMPFYQGRTDFGFRFPTRRVYCTAPTRIAEPGDTLV